MKIRLRLTIIGLLFSLSLAGETIVTLAGTGEAGSTDGKLDQPFGLTVGPDGALYVCEAGNHRVVKMPIRGGAYSVVAGKGAKGYSGDGGPARDALLNEPYELTFDADGNLYFVERLNHVVRRVDAKTGRISTLAGTGQEGFAGDGGGAPAQFRQPHSLVFLPGGLLLICDVLNYRIRAVELRTGMVRAWAGTGVRGDAAEGARYASAMLNGPRALAVDKSGVLYLALREGNAVFRLDTAAGTMTRFAGTGVKGYSGDGGQALAGTLSGPKGVACAPDGSVYIADTENHAIRKVDRFGILSTVAGTGVRGDGPDGEARKARLARPHGVSVGADGAIYIGDSENHRVRVIR